MGMSMLILVSCGILMGMLIIGFLLALAGPTTDYGCHRCGYQFSLWSYKEGITLFYQKIFKP